MKFLYVNIKDINDFLYLYNKDKNKISYFNKTIDEDQNVLIYNFYKDIKR